ncbi:hypothetical protein IC763_04055 [Acinetobacter seifertii]|nr:hypothetical protein IC763_04055 [Acinetobacter seifertii]
MDKPMTFNEWMGKQGNLALIHANCCRIAYEAGQQSKQAKVEELQTLYIQQGINMLKLQKRVDKALELMQKPVIVGEPTNYVCARFKELERALKGEKE